VFKVETVSTNLQQTAIAMRRFVLSQFGFPCTGRDIDTSLKISLVNEV